MHSALYKQADTSTDLLGGAYGLIEVDVLSEYSMPPMHIHPKFKLFKHVICSLKHENWIKFIPSLPI